MKKVQIDQRRAGIIAAVILGILAGVYLGGLFTQLNASYQKWLAADGIMNQAVMDPVDFNPLTCLPRAFSEDGRRITPVVFLGIGAVFVFIKLHQKWGKGEYDDRNFRKAREGTYGTAGWMSDREMKSVLEVTTPGKKRGESVVLSDPKSELYDDTSEMFRQNGYEVKVAGEVSVNVPMEDTVRELTVPDGHYFMLGDNSADSVDSRVWRQPMVPREQLVAKIWP